MTYLQDLELSRLEAQPFQLVAGEEEASQRSEATEALLWETGSDWYPGHPMHSTIFPSRLKCVHVLRAGLNCGMSRESNPILSL